MAQLAQGKTIRQVARALGYEHNGARSQVRDIERILEVSSVPEIVAYWDQHGEAWLAYAARCGGLR